MNNEHRHLNMSCFVTELFHLVQVGSIESKKVPNLANIFKMENSANEIGIYSKENKYE